MTWWMWILCVVSLYIAIGVASMIVLLQTPYALNPKWIMILFWPLYWIH